jgi:tetratricopeptide (TPR) repeat protein
MLENDKRVPTERVLAHLSSLLGLPVVQLVGPTPENNFNDGQRLELATAEMLLANGAWLEARDAFASMESLFGLPAIWGLARSLEALGDLEQALAVLNRVTAMASPSEGTTLVRAQIARARCLAEQGEEARALEAARTAVSVANDSGLGGSDEHVQALSMVVGQLYALGMYADAELAAMELVRRVELGSTWKARGAAYWNAAGVAEARGDLTTAVSRAQRALSILSEGDDDRAWARCAVACAWFLMRNEPTPARLDQVEQMLVVAEAKLRMSGSEIDLAYLETEQARVALLKGDFIGSIDFATSALHRVGKEQRSQRATALLVLSEAHFALGDEDAAVEVAQELELALLGLPRSRGNALNWRGLAEVWKRLGKQDAAYQALEEALNTHSVLRSPSTAVQSPSK